MLENRFTQLGQALGFEPDSNAAKGLSTKYPGVKFGLFSFFVLTDDFFTPPCKHCYLRQDAARHCRYNHKWMGACTVHLLASKSEPMPTAPGVPMQAPIQTLSGPKVAKLHGNW